MKTTAKYKSAIIHLYISYMVQAVVNNLLPLFFVILGATYKLDTAKLGSLILINFLLQLFVDMLASKYGDRLGYRKCMVLAHLLASVGLALISILPQIMDNTYLALIIAIVFTASGGGLIEVMTSPIMDAIGNEDGGKGMSLLHSFYCWGQVAVVFLTTMFLCIFGQKMWIIAPALWALLPFLNMFPFFKVRLPKIDEKKPREKLGKLILKPKFILMIILMLTAGAFELAMSQWASYFAEVGLNVSKTVGDLLGPCAFAVLMGISRVLYGILGDKINLEKAMLWLSVLGIASYIISGICLNPIIALIGCSLCGFAVGLMWPGIVSLAGRTFSGGTAMFGVLAMSGDLGCSLGPWLTGFVSDTVSANNPSLLNTIYGNIPLSSASIKFGVLVAGVFPLISAISIIIFRGLHKKEKR